MTSKSQTFRPTDIAGLRDVAAKLGVTMSTGKGAPPFVKLITAASAKGHTLDLSQYVSKKAVHGLGKFKVQAKVNGKGKPRTATVTVAAVREHVGKTGKRGRTSQNDVVATAAHKWGADVDTLTDVTVTALDSKDEPKPAVVRTSKTPKTASEPVSGDIVTDTPDVPADPAESNDDSVSDDAVSE